MLRFAPRSLYSLAQHLLCRSDRWAGEPQKFPEHSGEYESHLHLPGIHVRFLSAQLMFCLYKLLRARVLDIALLESYKSINIVLQTRNKLACHIHFKKTSTKIFWRKCGLLYSAESKTEIYIYIYSLKIDHSTSIGEDAAHLELYPFIYTCSSPPSPPQCDGEFD
jgi:hypothetical protein